MLGNMKNTRNRRSVAREDSESPEKQPVVREKQQESEQWTSVNIKEIMMITVKKRKRENDA